MKRIFLLSVAMCALMALSALGQESAETAGAPERITALKDAYAGKFLIGAASDLRRNSEEELANIKTHYDILTPENCMKPGPLHPTEDAYNWATADALVDWCEANNVKVWGHTLLWHSQTGRWFFEPSADGEAVTREVALARLERHIKTVVGRYKGRVIGWDVVNESIDDGGDGTTENLRENSWYETVGADVINMAFKFAKEADPDAKLYYNDYSIERGAVENTGKHASSLKLLKRLIDEGVPIDGVGIQGHWHLNSNLPDVEKAIENYAALGLEVAVTELDVTATGENSGAFGVRRGATVTEEGLQAQAEVYRKLFEIFGRHSDVVDRVTFWGLSDARSWRRGQAALIFYGDLKPKPAFHAIIDAAGSE